MVQPSTRNPLATWAYEKVGFRRLEVRFESARKRWVLNDYNASVYTVRTIR